MEEFLGVLKDIGGVASSLSGIIVLIGSFLTMSKRTRAVVKEKVQEFAGISEIKKEISEQSKRLTDHIDEYEKSREEVKKLESGMECILRKDIVRHCNTCISAGYITPEDLEALDAEFDSYVSLGGNKFVHDYVERAKKLPIKDVPSLFKGF